MFYYSPGAGDTGLATLGDCSGEGVGVCSGDVVLLGEVLLFPIVVLSELLVLFVLSGRI